MSEEDIHKKWVGGICVHDNKVLLIHRINNEINFTKEYYVFPGKDVLEDETLEIALKKAFMDISVTVQLGDLFYSKEEDFEDQEYYYTCLYLLGDPAVASLSDQAKEMQRGKQTYTPVWIKLSEIEDLIIYPESVKISILENLIKN